MWVCRFVAFRAFYLAYEVIHPEGEPGERAPFGVLVYYTFSGPDDYNASFTLV